MRQQLLHTMPVNDYQLQRERIDIWQFSLRNLPINARKLLNEEEQIRARRFHFQRHQRRFIIARAMMRTVLANYLDEKPMNLSFSYNPQGKPFLTHDCQIEFNLSHSGDLALLAVGQTFPLGVDLEYFSARPYEDIGRNLFSTAELAELSRQTFQIKSLVFFHIWAQKEAFIKASGMGLSYPTEQFTVPILSSNNVEIYDALHKMFWKIQSFMPEIACSAALCFNPAVTTLRKITVIPEQILASSIFEVTR
jgi:4'-phosphopantetheinyl transferase